MAATVVLRVGYRSFVNMDHACFLKGFFRFFSHLANYSWGVGSLCQSSRPFVCPSSCLGHQHPLICRPTRCNSGPTGGPESLCPLRLSLLQPVPRVHRSNLPPSNCVFLSAAEGSAFSIIARPQLTSRGPRRRGRNAVIFAQLGSAGQWRARPTVYLQSPPGCFQHIPIPSHCLLFSLHLPFHLALFLLASFYEGLPRFTRSALSPPFLGSFSLCVCVLSISVTRQAPRRSWVSSCCPHVVCWSGRSTSDEGNANAPAQWVRR